MSLFSISSPMVYRLSAFCSTACPSVPRTVTVPNFLSYSPFARFVQSRIHNVLAAFYFNTTSKRLVLFVSSPPVGTSVTPPATQNDWRARCNQIWAMALWRSCYVILDCATFSHLYRAHINFEQFDQQKMKKVTSDRPVQLKKR